MIVAEADLKGQSEKSYDKQTSNCIVPYCIFGGEFFQPLPDVNPDFTVHFVTSTQTGLNQVKTDGWADGLTAWREKSTLENKQPSIFYMVVTYVRDWLL